MSFGDVPALLVEEDLRCPSVLADVKASKGTSRVRIKYFGRE
jgi:hypothetical protein